MTDEEIRLLAHDKWAEEGELEIDDDAPVSRSSEGDARGAYVQAWVWVEFEND